LVETPRAVEPPLKHWRSFGAAEWRHVKDGALGLFLGSLLPVGLYYAGRQIWGFQVAVAIVLTWSALVFAWHYHRTGGADVFSATTFGFACVKAVAGLVSQNEWLYLAWPSLENVIYGAAFVSSALLGRPLLALYAERIYPISREVRHSSTFRRAFLIVSIAWLVGHTLRGLLRLWLLAHLPVEIYLIADTVAGWPINISLVAITTIVPLRMLRRAGYMAEPRELGTMDAVELAVEETAPTTV
jgi:hypothetical protein